LSAVLTFVTRWLGSGGTGSAQYLRLTSSDSGSAECVSFETGVGTSMLLAPIKTEEQQSALICAIRGQMAELGLIVPHAVGNMKPLLEVLAAEEDDSLPSLARSALKPLVEQLSHIDTQLAVLDRELLNWHRNNSVSQRLASIPGVGTITATAIAATVTDPSMFASAREFSA
jgi:transposase